MASSGLFKICHCKPTVNSIVFFAQKRAFLNAPIQVGLVGLFLVFATPMCCAFFPQQR